MVMATLAVRYDSTTWIVYENNNGTLRQIGNTVTTQAATTTTALSNFAKKFSGGLISITSPTSSTLQPRLFNPSTQDWEAQGSALANNTGINSSPGIHIGKDSSGLPVAVIPYGNGGVLQMATSSDGVNWSSASTGVTTGNPAKQAIKFRNTLYWANNIYMHSYNFTTGVATSQSLLQGNSNLANFARLGNDVFAITGSNTGSAYCNIYRLLSGSFQIFYTGVAGFLQSDAFAAPFGTSQAAAMHMDPGTGDLIVHGYQNRGASDRGWRVYRVDPSTADVTEITSTVLSGNALAYPNSTVNGTPIFHIQVDNDTDPTSQSIAMWFSIGGGAFTQYFWNGAASVITTGGSGGDDGIALTYNQEGDSSGVYSEGTTANPYLILEEYGARTPLPGQTRVQFKGWTFDESGGSPSDGVEDVEIRYNTTAQNAPAQQGTLSQVGKISGAAATPTLTSNQAVGVTFDGSSVFYMDWNVSADGFNGGDFVQTELRAV